ncbi:MAG: hydrogenase maturation protease [Actinobacteria bacterium]|nr:hydrogenase maturation protease [Actinomycetota bacterium]
MKDFIPEYYKKPVLVLGCGNELFGDDGFGPQTVEYLKNNYSIPENVEVINAGTSIRNLLFDIILFEKKPEKIIIVDAIDAGRIPGDIFEISIDNIPENKCDDFSMHQLPTSNLLKELKELCMVEIKIFACQVKNLPKSVSAGLSKKIRDSIPEMCKLIIGEISSSC